MLSADELKKLRKKFNDQRESFLTHAFKALGDVNRHRIFELLSVETQMSASDIAETLKILEQAELFQKDKIGQHKFYHLNRQNAAVQKIVRAIKKLY